MINKTYVLYHSNCLDGMMSAAIAYKYFNEQEIEAEYIPVSYQKDPPFLAPNSIVYIVDFSYPREVIIQLQQEHNRVIILDHHRTAQEQLLGIKGAFFDMNESGATMTWNYFYQDTPIPFTVQMIKDRDLWQWKLPQTKAFTEAVYNLLPMDVKSWQVLTLERDLDNLGTTVNDLINQGNAIVKASENQVQRQLNLMYWGKLPQHEELVPMINSPHLVSETCTAMYNKFPDALYVVMWHCEGDKVKVSLRSSKTGADVSAIAKVYGGGGHQKSSGFTIQASQWFQTHQ